MRNGLLAGAALAGLCAPAQGAQPVSVRTCAIVEGVAPGTRLTAEMRADYVVYDIRQGMGREGNLPELFRVKGVGTLRVDLVVPASGRARLPGAEIRFGQPLEPVPPGMAALIELPLRYEISCDGSSPACTPRAGAPSSSLRASTPPAGGFSACLQFRRGAAQGEVFVGVARDCEDPRKGASLEVWR